MFKRKSSERQEPRLMPADSPAPRPRRKRRKRRRPLILFLVSWTMTFALWGAIGLAAATGYVFFTLEKKGILNIPEREPGIMLLASDGHVLAERGSFFGDEARVSELPVYLPQAVMAIEDRRFRSHFGIDVQGLVRAAVANYQAGRIVQGGSTLTQQLAKNLFLKPERTLERKFQEAVLALWLESKYSKDQILQLYLNRVYFGAGAYGVEKAAKKYFGKSAKDVTLGEAAILAAVLKAPTTYNPLQHPERAAQRAREVINDMIESGFITTEEATRALSGSTETVDADAYIPATQFIVDWVTEQLPDLVGQFGQSIIVETTIDRTLQANAENAVRKRLAKDGKRLKASQAAIVVMTPKGSVLALVGGKSYASSQFNRVVKAKRQPGSAFKPFVFLTAVEQGLSPNSVEVDEPVTIGKWKPGNYSHKYRGPVTLKTALALSLNSVAAKLGAAAGIDNIITVAHRLGINSELQSNASISLGTSEVTLLELTSAYAPFANGGEAVVPHVVTRISTRDGKVLYERRGDGLGRVMTDYDVGAMNDMMRHVVERGTGRRARIKRHDIAGKTGTSQDYRDGWFIGYSSKLVAGVWVGNDDNTPTKRVTGGSLPAMIWSEVMTPAHAKLPASKLPGELREEDFPTAGVGGGRSFVQILQEMFGKNATRQPDFNNDPLPSGDTFGQPRAGRLSEAERVQRNRRRQRELLQNR